MEPRKEIIGPCELTREDCMRLMARYPDGYFDLAVVDPPYFKGPSSPDYYGGKAGPYRSKDRYSKTNYWDIPDQGYYNQLTRVSKEQIIFGINYFNFQPVPPGRIVWDKKNDTSTFSNGEIASCSLIRSVRFFRYMWSGFLREDRKDKEKRIHPTQKPVALYKWLLSKYAKPGWKILDTHLGSGSSAIACYDMGFALTACEIDKKYFDLSVKRIKETVNKGAS
jgi:site-specific DNA-methyltransferase (adenine-specific)